VHDPAVDFVIPYGQSPHAGLGWSSFPSDHAALFFALATGISVVSPRLGWLVSAYVILAIAAPRIYLGLHYPTDLVAGAILGVAAVVTANIPVLRRAVAGPAVSWASRHPPVFYALFFLFTFQVAVLFDQVRVASRVIAELAKAIIQRHLLGS